MRSNTSYPCTFVVPSDFPGLSQMESKESRIEQTRVKWTRHVQITEPINDTHEFQSPKKQRENQ